MTRVFTCLLFSLILMGSCKKDDCSPPYVGENIVGTWKVNGSSDTVVFLEDGTLLDPKDALISGEVNGMVLDQKSWSIVPGDYLLLRAENMNSVIESEFEIVNHECNRIDLEVFFVGIRLDRK